MLAESVNCTFVKVWDDYVRRFVDGYVNEGFVVEPVVKLNAPLVRKGEAPNPWIAFAGNPDLPHLVHLERKRGVWNVAVRFDTVRAITGCRGAVDVFARRQRRKAPV